jgi:hypothetical protein
VTVHGALSIPARHSFFRTQTAIIFLTNDNKNALTSSQGYRTIPENNKVVTSLADIFFSRRYSLIDHYLHLNFSALIDNIFESFVPRLFGTQQHNNHEVFVTEFDPLYVHGSYNNGEAWVSSSVFRVFAALI